MGLNSCFVDTGEHEAGSFKGSFVFSAFLRLLAHIFLSWRGFAFLTEERTWKSENTCRVDVKTKKHSERHMDGVCDWNIHNG